MPEKTTGTDTLCAAVDNIKAWMLEHGASSLVANLADGVDDDELDALQDQLELNFGAQLRTLYRMHDGQFEASNPFIENLNFLGVYEAHAERERFLELFVRSDSGVAAYDRHPSVWRKTPLMEEERTERWWPLAVRDSSFLVLNLDSGRVFWTSDEAPPLHLAAHDLTSFFEQYAQRLEDGEYTFEEGFGEPYLRLEGDRTAPTPKLLSPSDEPPDEVVDRVCEEVLENNLFFLIEDVEVEKNAVHVFLALHRHPAFHDRIATHPIITKPVEAFTQALRLALPEHKCSVELVPIDVDDRAFALYLRQAGPEGAPLLAEFKRKMNPLV